MAYRRIVVATDGSASAETAEHVAATLAAATGAKLTIAHAYANPDRAGDAVERAEKIAEREGAVHEVALSAEAPADAILMTASQIDTELIVIGSTGLSASEQLFGSVSRRVVTHAPSDVLLTRARPDDQRPHGAPPYRRLLIATDGSSTADRAARKGYALAKRLKASVTLLFVGHPKTGELVLQDTKSSIGDEAGVTSAIEIRTGDPSEEIVDAAASEGYDLVVIGNRGLTGAKAALLGSVPRDVAENAPCDVLVARTVAQSLPQGGGLPGQEGQRHDDVGQVHACRMHGEVGRVRARLAVPLSRLPVLGDRPGGVRAGRTPARAHRPVAGRLKARRPARTPGTA